MNDSFNSLRFEPVFAPYLSGMDAPTNNQLRAKSSAGLCGPLPASTGAERDYPQLENLAGHVSPRYMTPTAASRAQVSMPESHASTPQTTLSTGKRKAWMVSAAKRVGIVPSTPRSRKEGRVYKRISPLKAAVNRAGDKSAYQVRIVFCGVCWLSHTNSSIQATL